VKFKVNPHEVRKALVAAATVLSQALAMSLVPAPYDKYALLVLGALGAFGVFKVPNRKVAVPNGE
jgi:hypothetical protein